MKLESVRTRTTLFLLFLICFSRSLLSQNPHLGFQENKGQWHEDVRFRSELPNGEIYLLDKGFKFDLFDTKEMEEVHEKLHGPGYEKGPKTVQRHAYECRFLGARDPQRIEKRGRHRSYFNYYLGDDPQDWASKIHPYQELTYKGLYPGTDLRIKRPQDAPQAVKYELILEPGKDPSRIKIQYNGVEDVHIDDQGSMVIGTTVGEVVEEAPIAYQIRDGKKVKVPCEYDLKGTTLSFTFPDGYDQDQRLVIDPTLIFSTYSGSFSDNFGYSATFDSEGFLYSGSTAFGNQYPVTSGAYQQNWAGGTGAGTLSGTDIALSKYDTSGTFMEWSTYLGGSSDEVPHSLIVNQNDELFVYGSTSSPDFPVTKTAYDTTFNGGSSITLNGIGVEYNNGSDIIISRISNDGTALLASTFLGGTGNDGLNTANALKYNYADEMRGDIHIDEANNCYIASTTRSSDFPTTGGSYQPSWPGGNQNGCLIKMDNSLTTILWSTYFGGSNNDAVYSVVLDRGQDVMISGGTNSNDLPTTSGVIQPNNQGGRSDAFVAHLTNTGDSLINSTYWGSTDYDQSYFVELDAEDHVHLFGQTEIMDSTYIQNATYATPNSGQYVTQLTTEMDSVIWSTVFGSGSGNPNISPSAFLVDVCHKIYLSGWGGQTNQLTGLNNNAGYTNGMDITGNAYQSTTDGSDFYVMVLNDDASGIVYGSYMGGGTSDEHVDGGTSRFDKKGRIYQSVCAGCGSNSDFPIKPNPGAVSPTNNSSNCNNAVFKIDFNLPITVADFDHDAVTCINDTVQFTNSSIGGQDFVWDFGDGDTSTQVTPSHIYDTAGTFTIQLKVMDTASCNLADSITSTIKVLSDTTRQGDIDTICKGGLTQIGIPPSNDSTVTYSWFPSNGLSDSTEPNPIASPSSTTQYHLLISNGQCTDTLIETVQVIDLQLAPSPDTTTCGPGDPATASANSFGTAGSFQWSTNDSFTDTLNSSPLDSTIDVSPNQGSTYYVKIQKESCSLTDSMKVEVFQQVVSVGPDTTICEGKSVKIGGTAAQDSTITYDWEPDSSLSSDSIADPIASPTVSTQYQMIASNGTCSDTLFQTVTVQPLDLIVPADTLLCNSTAQLSLVANSGGYADTFHWSSNIGFTDTINGNPLDSTIAPSIQSDTTFYIAVENSSCRRQDTVNIGLQDLSSSLRPDTLICSGDTAMISLVHTPTTVNLEYDWSPDGRIIQGDSTSTILVSPTSTTLYTVVGVSSKGCTLEDSSLVEVSDLPNRTVDATATPDTIFTDGTTELQAHPDGNYQYFWEPSGTVATPTEPNTIATPPTTTTYHVKISDKGRCLKNDSVKVWVLDAECGRPNIFLPNAFTPNGDNENDILKVRGNNIREMTLKIYDRWGEKVFETHSQNKGWDGTYKGKPLDPDVYVYHLEVTCNGGKEFFEKGNVTIIR